MNSTNTKYIDEDGTEYWRISHVISYFQCPQLAKWRARVGNKEANRIQKEALKIGTRVDDLVETDWKTGSYKLKKSDPSEVLSCMEGWEQWKREYADDYKLFCASQEQVKLPNLGVAGTLDFRLTDSILDIKTSKKISNQYWVQTALYRLGTGQPLPFLRILRLDKELGTYEYETRDFSHYYINLFKGALVNFYDMEYDPMKGESR